MHACVSRYVCLWVCVGTCACECVFVYMSVICMCMWVYVYVSMCVREYAYTRVHVYVICMCMCVCYECVWMWLHLSHRVYVEIKGQPLSVGPCFLPYLIESLVTQHWLCQPGWPTLPWGFFYLHLPSHFTCSGITYTFTTVSFFLYLGSGDPTPIPHICVVSLPTEPYPYFQASARLLYHYSSICRIYLVILTKVGK